MTRFLTFLFCAIASASTAPIFQISQLLGPSPDSANYGSWVTDTQTTLGTGATSTLGVVDPKAGRFQVTGMPDAAKKEE